MSFLDGSPTADKPIGFATIVDFDPNSSLNSIDWYVATGLQLSVLGMQM